MASLASNRSTCRILIERLNWPIRMVRWRAANEFAGLLSSKSQAALALDVFLEWLQSRQFESEVVSALAVLMCTKRADLPSFETVKGNIHKPSILADTILESVYGEGSICGGWEAAHSGEALDAFESPTFFLKHKSAHVPPILSHALTDLERESGLPFMKQWAFEWQCLMDETGSPYSGFPYYFLDSLQSRSGVNGQFSQRQCDVYRSAYLRTLACAVSSWDMPTNQAAFRALESLPINRGLAHVSPIDRPDWLSDIPEKCSESSEDEMEALVRKLIGAASNNQKMTVVSLKVPISNQIFEFADLSVMALLVSSDFVPELDSDVDNLHRGLPWVLPDGISFSGPLSEADIERYSSQGASGTAVPVCLDLQPFPAGFWHNDYHQLGIALPAPYVIDGDAHIRCNSSGIDIETNSKRVGSWSVWHDHWTPLYVVGGSTRCGTVTYVDCGELANAMKRHDLTLGWLVEAKCWAKDTDFCEFKRTGKRVFFLD